MSAPTRSLAAAGVADLRTPLSRVALAMGQLARSDLGPFQQRLLDVIAEAVEDLDARVGRLLRVLVTPVHGAGEPPTDTDAVLAELHSRLGPVLAASAICWTPPSPTGIRLPADVHLVRRCGVALLRAAARCLEGGGALELRPMRDGDLAGLELALAPGTDEEPVPAADAALASFAADHHLSLETWHRDGRFGAVLWCAPRGAAS